MAQQGVIATMAHSLRSRQRGISFLGLLFVVVVLAVFGIIGAQVAPTYLEFMAVQKAVDKAKTGGSSVPEIRAAFDRAAQIDDIRSIAGKDLEITKQGDRVVIKFAYTRELHLTGPMYLLMKYEGQSK